MFNSMVTVGLLLGLDSLAVGIGLGAVIPDRTRRWLALSFALCDGLASLIGSMVGMGGMRSSLLWCEWLGPIAAASYGVYVLYLTWRWRGLIANTGTSRRLVFGLPLCLSVDNLVAGMGTEATDVPAVWGALTFALMSGGLALFGLRIGSALGRRSRFPVGWLSGAFLILVAAALVLKEKLLDLTAAT